VRELPWLHICHQLLRCQADALAPRVQALSDFCTAWDEAFPGRQSDLYRHKVHQLTTALRAYRRAGEPSAGDAFYVQDALLRFMMAPDLWGPPPSGVTFLLRIVSRLLQGLHPMPDGESECDSECFDDGVPIASGGASCVALAGRGARAAQAVARRAPASVAAAAATRAGIPRRSDAATCGPPRAAAERSDSEDEVDLRGDPVRAWQAGGAAGEDLGDAATATAGRKRRRDDGLTTDGSVPWVMERKLTCVRAAARVSDMGDRAWGHAQRAAEGQTLSSSNIVPPTSRGAVLRPMPDYG